MALASLAIIPVAFLTALDPATRKVTLTTPDGNSATFKADPAVDLSQFADGTTRTFKVPKSVDLSKHKVGETVVLGYAESLVIAVSEP